MEDIHQGVIKILTTIKMYSLWQCFKCYKICYYAKKKYFQQLKITSQIRMWWLGKKVYKNIFFLWTCLTTLLSTERRRKKQFKFKYRMPKNDLKKAMGTPLLGWIISILADLDCSRSIFFLIGIFFKGTFLCF